MSEGLAESVKQVVEERLKNPLWGFIILAWFWFNWPNLAMLFMSDAPVKFRIDFILSQDYFYLHFIVAPMLSGCLLAVVSPYAQWLLSQAHGWADVKYRDNVFQSKARGFEEDIKLSKLKVRSDMAVDAEIAKIKADIQVEVERGKREQLVTEELEAQKKVLEEKIGLLVKKFEEEKQDLEDLSEETKELQDLSVKILIIMEKSLKIDDRRSVAALVNEIHELFTVEEVNSSMFRNSSKSANKRINKEKDKLIKMITASPHLKPAEPIETK